MKNLKYLGKRGLALFLSLVLCLGLVPGTAAAAENHSIIIYKDEGEQEIIAALNEEFGVAEKWEYHDTKKGSNSGKCDANYWFEIGTAKGFSILGKNIYGYSHGDKLKTCYHTAISALTGTPRDVEVRNNAGTTYKVSLTISKEERPSGKSEAQVTLNKDPVMLVHKYENGEDLGINWEAVANTILNRATFTDPASKDELKNVRVEYRSANIEDTLNPWKPVTNGGMDTGLAKVTGYKIRIAWDANDTYDAGTAELGLTDTIKFPDREEFTPPKALTGDFSATSKRNVAGQINNAVKAAVDEAFDGKDCGTVSYEITNAQIGESTVKVSWKGTPAVKGGNKEYTIVVADSRPDATVKLTGTYAVNGYNDVAEQLVDAIKKDPATANIGDVTVTVTDAKIGENTVTVAWEGTDDVKSGRQEFTVTVTDNRGDYQPTYDISRFEVTDYSTEVTAQIKAAVEQGFDSNAPGRATVEVSVNSKNATVTVTWAGNETYKPGSNVYDVEVVDNRTPITLTGNTASVDLVFTETGVLDADASKTAAVEAVKALVPTEYQSDVTIEGSVTGEGTVDFIVTRKGTSTVMDLDAKVAVTFTDARTATAIALKDGKTAFDVMQNGYTKVYGATGAEDLNDAIWATAVDAENTSDVVTKDCMTVNGNNVTIEFKGNAANKPATVSFTYQVVDSRAAVSFAENPKATLGFNEDGSTNYDMTAENISKAVFGEQITLGYGDMELYSVLTVDIPFVGTKEYPEWTELKGKNVTIAGKELGYPAISDGPQTLRFTFDGDENYQGFTNREVIVTMKDREPSSITLDENAYVVSVGKNPSTDDIKAAIINQVVKEVTPEDARESLTVQYNANSLLGGDKVPFWKDLDGIPMQKEVQIKISWNGNRDYKGCETEPKEIILDNRLATRIVLNEGQSVVYEYYNDEYAALEQSVLNAVLNTAETTVPMPAEPALSIKYKAAVELKAGETTFDINEVVNSINKLLPEGSKIDKDTILKGLDTAWVDFKGGEATITTEDLGALNDIINALPVGKDWIREKIDKILGGIDLSKVASYPAITAGEQEVKVSYAGNSEYCPSSATVKVTIEKAPAKVSVNSKTVCVDEEIQPMYSAVRTDNGRNVDVEAYVVYAGLSANVTLDLYLQIPESAKKTLSYKAAETALKAVGIDLNGTITLRDLFKGLGSWEKVADLLKKLGIGDTILEQISNAIGGIGSSDSEILQKAVEALRNGLNGAMNSDALENVTITINGDPKGKAGVYGVAAFLSDQNYRPEKDWKIMSAGYLVIKLHTIDVKVGNAKIKPEEELPEGFVTTDTEGAQVYTIYAGTDSSITTSVWLELPEGRKLSAGTVGELKKLLAEQPDEALGELGIDSSVLNAVLTAVAGLPGGKLDDVPVYYGVPNKVPGVYAVTAIASKPGYGLGVGAGSLIVELAEAPAIDVKDNAVCYVDEKIPEDLVTYKPDTAKVITMYAGVTSNVTTGVWLDVPNVSSLSAKTLGELKDLLAAKPERAVEILKGLGVNANEELVAWLLEQLDKLPGTALDDVPVVLGTPVGQAGFYTVTAAALLPNALPAVDAGTLTIKLRDDLTVKVNDTEIYVGKEIPASLVETTPAGARTLVLYAGVSSKGGELTGELYIDGLSGSNNMPMTLEELKERLANNEALQKDYGFATEILKHLPPTEAAKLTVTPGRPPVDKAGVYSVIAGAIAEGSVPAVDAGTLTIKLRDDLQVTVDNKLVKLDEIAEGEDIFAGLVTVEPNEEGVRTLVLYAGLNAESGRPNGVLYIDGLSETSGKEMTLEELRQRLVGNETLQSEYKLILAAIEKLPASEAGKWTVTTGKPPVAAGTYTVAAAAIKSGSLPAVGIGSLTIIDREVCVILYVAEGDAGTVRLNGSNEAGRFAYEILTTTKPEAVGAVAEVKESAQADYHFEKWTNNLGNVFDNAEIQPVRPVGLLSQLPEWVKERIPNFDQIPDLTRIGAVYVASFKEHTWDAGVVTKEPTCTKPGEMTYTCTKVGCGATKTEEIAELGHTMEVVPGSRPDCGNEIDGVVEHWRCTVCNREFADQLGNTPWNAETGKIPYQHRVSSAPVPGTPATCTENGTKEYWECLNCHKHFGDILCTQELTDLTVAALGHDWQLADTTPSNCEDSGVTEYHCSRCDAVKRVTTAAAGHTWGEGVPVTGNICGDETAMQYTCTVCGAVRIQAGDLMKHTAVPYGTVTATCTTDGHSGGSYCSLCNAELEAWTVESKHHTPQFVAEVSKTCITNGTKAHYHCEGVCGKNYEDEACTIELTDLVIPASHTPVSADNGVAATCVAPGHESDIKCSVCGNIITAGAEIPVDSSNHANIVDDTAVPATCTATGLTAGRHCEACHTVITAQEAAPMLPHTEVTDAAVAATCTTAGKTEGKHCSVCNTVLVAQTEVAALGHNYNTSVVTVQPGAYTTGVRTYICANDPSHTYTEVIPATGGEYDPGINITPPTITTPTVTPGGGTTTIPDTQVPQSGDTSDDATDIEDLDVPLAMLPTLNSTDHFAYIKGYEDGTVRPKNNITRAEVASIFFRLLTDAYRDSVYAVSHSFTDAPADQWYNEAIATIANAGLLKGYEDGTVRPNKNITRAEFVTIAANFLMDEGDGEVSFTDIQGHWAEDDIKRVAAAGWIMGDGDGRFRPNDSITRAEVVTVINRILGRATKADKVEMMDGAAVWPDCTPSDWWYVAVQEAANGHEYESGETERWTALL